MFSPFYLASKGGAVDSQGFGSACLALLLGVSDIVLVGTSIADTQECD